MSLWWVLISLLALLVLLMIFFEYRYRRALPSFWKIYGKSSGNFDNEARTALRGAMGRGRPSDHLLVATVLTRNVLSQEIGSRKEAERAQNELMNRAREHYRLALQGIGLDGGSYESGSGEGLGEMFIVETVTDFALGARPRPRPLRQVQASPGEFIHRENRSAVDHTQEIVTHDTELVSLAKRQREKIIHKRQESASSIASDASRGGVSSAYLDLAIQHTDDPQNAHDTGVNACLRSIMERLRVEQKGASLPKLDEIKKSILSRGAEFSENRDRVQKDVLSVIEKAQKGEKNIAIGSTDEEVLRRLWARSYDVRNKKVKDKMQQAIYDSLADSWEDGFTERKMVCVNGRISRMLGSLALLDCDPKNWEVKKFEQFKNDIFEKTRILIRDEAQKALDSPIPELRVIAKTYLAETPEELSALPPETPDSMVSKDFVARLHSSIDNMIDSYSLELGIELPPQMVEGIREEAKAAVI